MKNIFTILFLLVSLALSAQEDATAIKTDLLRLNAKTTAEMNSMTRMEEGSMCYNEETKSNWQYIDADWTEIKAVTAFGDLTGSARDNADLDAELDLKADDDEVIHLTGETISSTFALGYTNGGGISIFPSSERTEISGGNGSGTTTKSLLRLGPDSMTFNLHSTGTGVLDYIFNGNYTLDNDVARKKDVDAAIAGAGTDDQTAAEVSVDASGFDGNLDTDDDDVQKVAQKLDDLAISSGGIVAEGVYTIPGGSQLYTINHNLGYAPSLSRFSLNSSTSVNFIPLISNITSTTFDLDVDVSTSFSGEVYWKIFGPDSGTPLDFEEIASGLDTELGSADWRTGGSADAADIDITDSGAYFTATDVEGALQELGAGGGTDDQTAAEVSYDNSDSTLSADDVKEALDELDSEKGGLSTANVWTGTLNNFQNKLSSGLYHDITGIHGVAIGGQFHDVLGNLSGTLGGDNLITGSYSEVAVGTYNVDNTGETTVTIVPTDRIFSIGIGTSSGSGRKNALTVLKNGTITAPELSIAEINAAGNTSLTTKEYVDSVGGGGTDDQTGAEVNITDSGDYYTGTNVEAALQEVGADLADKIGSDTSGRSSATAIENIYEQDYDDYISDGAPAAGTFVLVPGAPPIKVETSATFDLSEKKVYDDQTADAATITLSGLEAGVEFYIYLDRASMPSFSGATDKQIPGTQSFIANTPMVLYGIVRPNKTTFDYSLTELAP